MTNGRSMRRSHGRCYSDIPKELFFLSVMILFPVTTFAQTSHALLIGGLGGSTGHTEAFKNYLFDTRTALIDRYGFESSNVVVLGETRIEEEAFVKASSRSENIQAEFDRLKQAVAPEDIVYVMLFGHGSFDDNEAMLNIPRRDLGQSDYAALVDGINASRIIFVNAASSSGPFVEALAAEGRIVITATRTGTQKNETRFPVFWVAGLTDPLADSDKDGLLSLLELFRYTASRTDQWYADEGIIATEHALLDDTGEGIGARVGELDELGKGTLASLTRLGGAAGNALIADANVPAAWMAQRATLEAEIASLKSRKDDMAVDAYYEALQELLIQLARGNREAGLFE